MSSQGVLKYVRSNRISWVTPCGCNKQCKALQLAPPTSTMASPTEREHLATILRLAAQSLQAIVFVGEGCCAMAQSPTMRDALSHFNASSCLRAVRFVDIADIDQIAPLLRALERCPKLMWLTCPIEAYLAPAVQQLQTQSRSLSLVTVVVDNATQFRHLSAAAALRNKQRIELHFSNCDDTTAQQLVDEFAALFPPNQPRWTQIMLANASIERRTYDQLKSECARFGNDYSTLNSPVITNNPHACMAGMSKTGSFDWVPHYDGIDLSQYKMLRFDNFSAGDAEQNLRKTLSVVRGNSAAHTNGASAKQTMHRNGTAVAPLEHKPRRVRGFVALHCQKGPAELAPEFVRGDDNAAIAAPTPPPPQTSALLCANADCKNSIIYDSEFHVELVCAPYGHTTRVHKTCLPALALSRCDGGDCCPMDGCVDGVVAQRTLVRIDEQGERHIPASERRASVDEKAAAAAPTPQLAGAKKSKNHLQRKQKNKAHRVHVAAASQPAAVAVPTAVPATSSPPQHTTPPAAAPLAIDDSEDVRRKARGEVACTRLQKDTGTGVLFVKINGKKNKKPPHRAVTDDNNADDSQRRNAVPKNKKKYSTENEKNAAAASPSEQVVRTSDQDLVAHACNMLLEHNASSQQPLSETLREMLTRVVAECAAQQH